MYFPMRRDFVQKACSPLLLWDQYLALGAETFLLSWPPVSSFSLTLIHNLLFLLTGKGLWSSPGMLNKLHPSFLASKVTALSPLLMSGSARQTEIGCSGSPTCTYFKALAFFLGDILNPVPSVSTRKEDKRDSFDKRELCSQTPSNYIYSTKETWIINLISSSQSDACMPLQYFLWSKSIILTK